MADEDYAFALQLQNEINSQIANSSSDVQFAKVLQAQFEAEAASEAPTIDLTYTKKGKKPNLNSSKSLVDPSWEVIDPTPDIHTLFVAFNQKYFWDKLVSVCISWSKRMTSCAGICSYSPKAGLCSITLSEPLLKLRPRKDLVETMLHEMIHAYLFITQNNRDRDGHGPEFHKHMYRINAEAGTNITVYHDFHDEVNLYKQHIWRCDGPCQHWKPYFGIVKRAMNRAPGPYDRWFGEHSRNCGGTFTKIQEPEKAAKTSSKDKKLKKVNPSSDIRNFFPKPSLSNSISPIKGPNPPKSNKSINPYIPNTNIHGFSNLNGASCSSSNKENEPSTSKSNFTPFAGKGHKLGDSPPAKRLPSPIKFEDSPKRLKMEKVSCPVCNLQFPIEKLNEHLDKCLESQRDDRKCVLCFKNIPKKSYDEHVLKCSEDQAEIEQIEPSEQKQCPVCSISVPASNYDVHLGDCLLSSMDNALKKHTATKDKEIIEISDAESDSSNSCPEIVNCLVCQKKIVKTELYLHLEECMDNLFDKTKELNDSMAVTNEESDSDDGELNKYYENVPEEAKAKFLPCPVCFKMFPCYVIDSHVNDCLK